MDKQLSEMLHNILGLLLLEGAYDIKENDDSFLVSISTSDAGRLIGFRGEGLEAFQLILSQMLSKKIGPENQFKRVIIDVEGWRKQKESELSQRAQNWAQQVLETGEVMELEPMPSWQRRIIHIAIQEMEGVASESAGEGRDRHLIIRPEIVPPKKASKRKKKAA